MKLQNPKVLSNKNTLSAVLKSELLKLNSKLDKNKTLGKFKFGATEEK